VLYLNLSVLLLVVYVLMVLRFMLGVSSGCFVILVVCCGIVFLTGLSFVV